MDEQMSREREAQLMALLHDLVVDIGHGEAAKELGVDRKTLGRSMNGGRLTPRLAETLERRALYAIAERSPPARRARVRPVAVS